MKIYNNITELIGKTPLVKINNITKYIKSTVLAKIEFFNPGASVKDRIAFSMIQDAENKGLINKNTTIIEPTSGNTGIGIALVSAVKKYKVILTMPDTMSIERQKLLSAYGATIELTPGHLGMKGSIEKAEELHKKIKNSFIPQQFKNPANPEIHRKTTAIEILNDTKGKIDFFVAGIGTGGTITGVGEILKKEVPNITIVGMEPKDSAILSGNDPGPHMIQGIGAGFVPDVLNQKIIDEIITISNEDAFEMSKRMAKEEGILCGISSGANIKAALNLAEKNPGKTIVTLCPDTGERYLSTSLFN